MICFCGRFQRSYSTLSSKFENMRPLQHSKYMPRKRNNNNHNVQSHVLDGGVCCLARLSFPFLCKPLIPDRGEGRGKMTQPDILFSKSHTNTQNRTHGYTFCRLQYLNQQASCHPPPPLSPPKKIIATRKAQFEQMLHPRGFHAAIY